MKKTISRAILSIRNQNISDIEIILVNDFSYDGSLSIIEDLAKKDQRIKVMGVKKNMGTYFCKSIGNLSAKGKYIYNYSSYLSYYYFIIHLFIYFIFLLIL